MTFNLADVFVALGNHHLNRLALISSRRQLTFGELVTSASQTAHALAAHGVEPNQNVGLAMRDGIDIVINLVALWMIDATGIVIDFRSPAGDRTNLAEEFDLVAILADNAPADATYSAIAIGGEWQERVARQPTTPPASERLGNGIAVISLTSGTTGRPLGLLIRHEDTLRRLAQNAGRYGSTPGLHLNVMPMHFSAARATIIAKLVQGNSVYIYPPLFSVEEFVTDFVRINPDSGGVVPTMLRGLLQYAEGKPVPLFANVKEFTCGGSMMFAHEKIAALDKITPVFAEGYASSLCGSITYLPAREIREHADTVGRILPMVRCELVDDDDQIVPVGTPGNIRARTPSTILGTYKDRTRPFGDRLKGGWVYPGDMGVLDAGGYLRIVGRSSEVIIRGGGNVHPSEIESVIATHPAVKGVAVVGYDTEREGEEIAAFIISQGALTENDLLAFTRSQLPPDKRPRKFIFIDAMPLTAIGKPNKSELKKLAEG